MAHGGLEVASSFKLISQLDEVSNQEGTVQRQDTHYGRLTRVRITYGTFSREFLGWNSEGSDQDGLKLASLVVSGW